VAGYQYFALLLALTFCIDLPLEREGEAGEGGVDAKGE
jgi:hypothetical protein